jgi:hypothetical protein
LPPQTKHLGTAKPEHDRDEVHSEQPVVASDLQDLAGLLNRQRLAVGAGGTGCLHQLGGVARQQLLSDRVLQGHTQGGVHVLHGSR